MGKLRVLVLGDGLLGSELIRHTGWDFVSRKKTNFSVLDIESSITGKYDVIVNCIANTDTYSTNKNEHWLINYAFVSHLIKYCNDYNIKLVHISTDYIYSGSISQASEEDVPVHCNSWYCYTKLLADGLVQLQTFDYLLIRCTHKPNPFPYESAWVDQIGNFDYVTVISNLIINLIENNQTGVFNVGSETKTMYELAKQTNPIVGKSFLPVHVPNNTSMCITKMKNAIK